VIWLIAERLNNERHKFIIWKSRAYWADGNQGDSGPL
jgi:hypothetical protein